MDKLNGKSLDLEEKNVEELKKIFPNVIAEGKIDFDKLRLLLGEEVDDSMEKYQFLWKGKNKAIKLAQTPSTASLRPDKGNSKNWETTENLYIEGDNLEVLKQLQKTYFGKIKMIYIDPPYNTGGDFVYKDDFKNTIKNYMEQTNQSNSSNPQTSGRYHTDWLNMMYPRLVLAKNLLADDGVIFVNIGLEENSRISLIMDEIFGELNNLTMITRIQKRGGNKGNFFNPTTDFIHVYAKSIQNLSNFVEFDIDEKIYNKTEISGARKGEKYAEVVIYMPNLDYRPNQRFFIEAPDGSKIITPEGKSFRWSEKRFNEELRLGNVSIKRTDNSKLIDEFGNQSNWIIYQKRFLSDTLMKGTARPNNLIEDCQNNLSNSELSKLGIPFDYAKPTKLLLKLMKYIYIESGDIVLDFFSGSATTAHAVMQLNAEDGGNRKFIMVQLPEKTDEKSEAYKAGYKNICEIGKERIRRAGEQIKKELIEKKQKAGMLDENIIDPNQLDIGFKVFKLDETNIKPWDSSLEVDEKTLLSQIEVIKENRTKEDVLYEILLKYGVFNEHVKELSMNGQTIYSIAENYMIVNLNDRISSDDIKSIAQLKPSVVVFLENGFADDNQKINAEATLKHQGIEDVKCI